MTYDDVKKVDIPLGEDVVIFDIITSEGERYYVASKSSDGARRKIMKRKGKNVTIISINEKERGIL